MHTAHTALKEEGFDGEVFVDELKPGTTLFHGQYTIERFLNSGGFAMTYLAKDSLDRRVVIKECFPAAFCRRSRTIVGARSRAHQGEFRSIVKLFVQEARSLAKLRHPNIVGVHQVFEDNDTAYMALDYIEGRDMLDTLHDAGHALKPKQIQNLLNQVLCAVAFIHDHNVLHRDISPDNILIDKSNKPILIDFGAAREEATKASRVLSAMRVVKDGYSPQEFYITGSAQGPSSDLYALSASFYHLITGETPPNSQARLAAVAAGEADPYVSIKEKAKGFDAAFLEAMDKALNIFPKNRIQSAQEWLKAINPALQDNTTVAREEKDTSIEKTVVDLVAAERVPSAVARQIALYKSTEQVRADKPVAADKTAARKVPDAIEAPAAAPTRARLPKLNAQAPEPKPEAIAPKKSKTGWLLGSVAMAGILAVAYVSFSSTGGIAPSNTSLAAPVPQITAPVPVSVVPLAPVRPQIPAAPDKKPVAPAVHSTAAAAASTPEPAADAISDKQPAVLEPKAIPEKSPAEVQEATAVMSRWSADLPFTIAENEGTVIGAVEAGAESWMQPGVKITQVNGIAVETLADIQAALSAIVTPGQASEVSVLFGIQDGAGDGVTGKVALLKVVQDVALLDGTQFRTAYVGGEWQTQVTSAAERSGNELKAGDVLIAYLSTNEEISGQTTLADILQREINDNTTVFNFAVSRNGEMRVVSLDYRALPPGR